MNFGQIIAGVVNAIGSILNSLKGSGFPIGSLGDFVLKEVEATQVDEANYLAGQAVVLAPFSYQGQAGTILVVKNGGPAAQSLGL